MIFFISSFQQTFTRHKTTGSISTTWFFNRAGVFPTLGALCDFLHLLGLTLQGVGSTFFFGQGRSQSVTLWFLWMIFVEVNPIFCWFIRFLFYQCRMEKLKHEMKIHHVGWKNHPFFLILRYFFSDKNSWSKNSLEAPIFFYGFVEIHKKNWEKKKSPFARNPKRNRKIQEKKVENWMFKEDEEKNRQISLTPRFLFENTSSTAQGGGGSFKKRKPIGEVGCLTIPGTSLSAILGLQPSKTRPFTIKARVIWVPGIYTLII